MAAELRRFGASTNLVDAATDRTHESSALAVQPRSLERPAGPLPDVLGADRKRFARRHTFVVGMGHSAANTLLALVQLRAEEPDTQITRAIRGRSPARLYGGGDADGLPGRGLLGSTLKAAVASGAITLVREFAVTALTPAADGTGPLTVTGTAGDGEPVSLAVDAIAAATGFRPDFDMLREVRIDLDPAMEAPAGLAPLIDPNFHSCGTVPPHGEELLRPAAAERTR